MREKYFKTKNKKKTNNKPAGTIGVESPDDNEQDTAAPTNLSSAFKPILAFPGKTKFWTFQ